MRTPGKWHVRTTYNGRSITKSYWIAPEGPEPRTEALAKLMRHNRNRIDDANLMAAAPELLAALKAVLEFAIQIWESEFQTSEDHHCDASAVKQAQAIIARIEGRS